MSRNEEQLLTLDFEGILKFLASEVFDCYKVSFEMIDWAPWTLKGLIGRLAIPCRMKQTPEARARGSDDGQGQEEDWLADDFVRDAYKTQMWVQRLISSRSPKVMLI